MWKHSNGEDHGDEYGSGGHDGSGGAEHGYGSGDDDWYPESPKENGMLEGMWEMVMPVFDYINSREFCELFHLMPNEWGPQYIVDQCLQNFEL